MSLFSELKVSAEVYKPQDSDTTKKTTWRIGSRTYDFLIDINLIRIGDQDAIIEGDQLGEWRAYIDHANKSLLREGQIIFIPANDFISQDMKLQIVGKPRIQKLFNNRVKINLKLV